MIGRWMFAALLVAASMTGEASAQGRGGWISCAQENGFCRVPYPTTVRYGARGAYSEVQTERGVPCNNDVFGDPLYGVRKACWYRASHRGWEDGADGPGGGWRTCASEGQWCDFSGRATVRYGIRGRWVTLRARDGIECSNSVFGDPVVGVRKICQVDR